VIRNIIFDWSGTLVDDLPAVWQATNYVLAQANRAEMTLEEFRAEFQLPFTTFYDKHTPHVPLAQLEDWFHTRFKQVQDTVCALPYARQFIEFCQTHKLRAFVLSTVREDHFEFSKRRAASATFSKRPISASGTSGRKSTKSSRKTNCNRMKRSSSATCNMTSKPRGTAASMPALCSRVTTHSNNFAPRSPT